jgi:hypothetical protein
MRNNRLFDEMEIINRPRTFKRCPLCDQARSALCVGPCPLRDIAEQMRNASQEREEVEHA